MIIIGIAVSIILFSIIVLIHEFGHFKAARIFGVKVEEFGLGIPPKAKKLFTDKKGTIFTLNWLPLGGFVRLKGENSTNIKNSLDKDNLSNISAWKQCIIILAGVFMNFVLAFIIFSTLFFIGVKPIGINTKVETNLNIKLVPNIQQALTLGLLEIKDDSGKYYINKNFKYKYGFFQSIKYGGLETINQSLLTFKALGILAKKIILPKNNNEREEAIKQVSGPVGLVDFISSSISAGFIFLVIITAIISINLGVFNLLPIPALDGGRFLFIIINSTVKKIFGVKIINNKAEIITNLIFFAFLILLSIIITYNDIIKIFEK